MQFETVILDLDGPLLDGMSRHYRCYGDILAEHGFEPIPIHEYWELKRNRVDRRRLLAVSGAIELHDEFLALWMQRIETKEYLALDRLQHRVAEILNDWKESRVRLMLATMRNNPANLHWQLDQLGIDRFLEEVVIVGSDRAGANKAESIKPLLDVSRLEQAIWIGDTEVDIHAARELGIKVCALTCGLRTENYLASFSPDFLLADLNSFAKNSHDQ